MSTSPVFEPINMDDILIAQHKDQYEWFKRNCRATSNWHEVALTMIKLYEDNRTLEADNVHLAALKSPKKKKTVAK